MLATTTTYTLDGLTARRVTVEAAISNGLPQFTIHGSDSIRVREIRERVRCAILNEGFDFPNRKLNVQLTGDIPRYAGPSLDLPIALAVLFATRQLDSADFADSALIGELSLDGALHPVRGVLSVAEAAQADSIERLFVPRASAQEALLANPDAVVALRRLGDLKDYANGIVERVIPNDANAIVDNSPDLQDLRGHEVPTRAMEISAAGHHNMLLTGIMGCGRTMLARRLTSILPPMTREEALRVTRIQSAVGSLRVDALASERPYRAPHNTTSASGLVGGGAYPFPGEATRANDGVLFLDQLEDFSTRSLESLCAPLEDREVTVTRNEISRRFPADFLLVAAASPCPCGASQGRCSCTTKERERHNRRLTGPFFDHFDITCDVTKPTAADVATGPLSDSTTVRERVTAAREIQLERFAALQINCNGQLSGVEARRLLRPTEAVHGLLNDAYKHQEISLRGYDRILRISRTIADLAGSTDVHEHHAIEALEFASFAKPMPLPA